MYFNLLRNKNNILNFFFYLKQLFFRDFLKINKSHLSLLKIINIIIFNIILNLINLLPFSFCLFSQYYIFISFTVIVWISCIINSIIFNFKNIIIHLTPLGCPLPIRIFINLIELIRMIIRPITLSVRITANLLAGHLLIHLIREFSFFLRDLRFFITFITFFLIIILNILEIGVSIIQPYIFSTLINIYFSENT